MSAYSIVDLGPFAGWDYSIAWAINDGGNIAGHSGKSPNEPLRATFWKPNRNGHAVDIGTLGSNYISLATSINIRQMIVGASSPTICQDNPLILSGLSRAV